MLATICGIAAGRRRLDAELVRRELATSRESARQAVKSGDVLVNGSVADKPARQVLPGDAIVLKGPPPQFVGRGGEKLAGALEAFSIDPNGCRCLDVGSSTGGFTDCLLQQGASQVIAVDVGRAQLHEKLRGDPRVDVREQTDIRTVTLESIGSPVDLVVCDVSFIGLHLVLPTMLELLDPFGVAIVLVKPQFEAGKAEASKGRGVITDPAIWERVLHEVLDCVTSLGAMVVDARVSPIKGGSGNVEFLFLIQQWEADDSIDVPALIATAQHLD